MLARRAEIVLALRLAPGIVKARRIVLVDELALAHDDNGVNVRVGRRHAGWNAAQTSPIEADVLRFIGLPAVVEHGRRAAGLQACWPLRKHRKRDDRQHYGGSNSLHACPQPVGRMSEASSADRKVMAQYAIARRRRA